MTSSHLPMLAIDIGGSKLMAAVCLVDFAHNSGGKSLQLLQKSHRPLAPTTTTGELLMWIDSAVDEVFDAADVEWD